MKKICLAFILVLTTAFCFSQNVSVTATLGTTSRTYLTLKEAFDSINTGRHKGAINIRILKNTTETATCELDSSGIATGASYTSVLIRPADTATVEKTVSTSVSSINQLMLLGADNVTIDGRPGGTGSNKFLNFTSSSNSSNSIILSLQTRVDNFALRYCTLNSGATNTTTSGNINITGGCNNQLFTANYIYGSSTGAEITGSGLNNNITFSGNEFKDQTVMMIKLTNAIGNVTIDSNLLHSPRGNVAGFAAIYILKGTTGYTVKVSRNKIYDIQMPVTNILTGIWHGASGAFGTTLIQNNSISFGSSSSPLSGGLIIRGILLQLGGTGTAKVEHNTVRIGGVATGNSGNPTSYALMNSSGGGAAAFSIRNNLFINTRTGSSAQHVGLYNTTAAASTNSASDYNTIHGSTSDACITTTFYTDVNLYRTAISPSANEAHSNFSDIDFTNATDPDLTAFVGNNTSANLSGTPVGITTDIYNHGRSSVTPYRGAYESVPLSTLPVTLLNFTAQVKANDVNLQWKTTNELNNKGFYVEYSQNGNTFKTLGFVQSNNSYDYAYSHAAAFSNYAGKLFYRLKTVDVNEKSSYSPIVAVSKKGISKTMLTVYPNPVKDALRLNVAAVKDVKASFIITDMNGRTMFTTTNTLISGSNLITLTQTDTLSKGVYFVKLLIDGEETVARFVKAQ